MITTTKKDVHVSERYRAIFVSVSRTLSSPSTRSRLSKDTVLLRGAPNASLSVGAVVDAHCALDSKEPEHPELISNVTYIGVNAHSSVFRTSRQSTCVSVSFSRVDAHLQISSQVIQRAQIVRAILVILHDERQVFI